MTMEQALIDILKENKVPDDFAVWLEDQGITSTALFACRIDEAKQVDEIYVDGCNKEKSGTLNKHGHAAAIKLVWGQLRKR